MSQRLTIKEMYPHLSPEEVREVEETFDRYLDFVRQTQEIFQTDPALHKKFRLLIGLDTNISMPRDCRQNAHGEESQEVSMNAAPEGELSPEIQEILRMYFRFVVQLHRRITSDPKERERIALLTEKDDARRIKNGRSLSNKSDTDV